MSDDEARTLEAQLGDNDWAIIIGKDGNLKGLFIPDGMDEDLVPDSIVAIMEEYFGVDFDEEIEDTVEVPPGETLH
jgi:hypothetical protein